MVQHDECILDAPHGRGKLQRICSTTIELD